MTDRPNNPYSAPASQVDDGIPDGFSWTVALLAGSAGFGAAYTIGSLLSPLWQHLLIGSGVPIEQLYYAFVVLLCCMAPPPRFPCTSSFLQAISAFIPRLSRSGPTRCPSCCPFPVR